MGLDDHWIRFAAFSGLLSMIVPNHAIHTEQTIDREMNGTKDSCVPDSMSVGVLVKRIDEPRGVGLPLVWEHYLAYGLVAFVKKGLGLLAKFLKRVSLRILFIRLIDHRRGSIQEEKKFNVHQAT